MAVVDFETFRKAVPYVIQARFPVMLRGKHGIGKSEVVYQLAEELGLPVVERRASQMTEGDLLGLPVINGDATEFKAFDWYQAACRNACILFLDEVDRASIEVRQGIFELCDSRKISGKKLHPDTLVFAAVNGGSHGSQYQVGEMDPAELDRWTVFDIEPTHADWIEWATTDGKIDKIIVDFLRNHPAELEHSGADFEPNKVYPSRRSWARFNAAATTRNGVPSLLSSDWNPILTTIASAFLGMETALRFTDFYKSYDRQVQPADIFNGRLELTKDWTVNEYVNMIDMMFDGGWFVRDGSETPLTAKQHQNFRIFFAQMDAESKMKFMSKIGLSVTTQPFFVNFAWNENGMPNGDFIEKNIIELFLDPKAQEYLNQNP
jgi:hypothetical protein